jgi:hypothetical protein
MGGGGGKEELGEEAALKIYAITINHTYLNLRDEREQEE